MTDPEKVYEKDVDHVDRLHRSLALAPLKKNGAPEHLARKPEGRVTRAEADFGSLGEVANL
jgi:hypothetical protein